jgi:DNA processing protein
MSEVWEVDRDGTDYPPGLLDLRERERPRLYGVGDREALLRLIEEPAVTIVGARRASAYGLRVAEELARDLALARVTVVSGMALGIDSAAHRGALTGGGTTVAVLAGGPDRASPPSNRELYGRILASGAVVSEHPPGSRVEPRHFAERNRIMAALGDVVVIVEAAQPSGSMITARVASELDRELGAVPGPIGVRVAEGCNDLIKECAHLIRGSEDVLDLLFGVGADAVGAPRRARTPRRGPDLEPALAAVLDLVTAGASTVDRVAAEADIEARDAAVALARLELLRYVRADELGGYAVTGLRPRPE